MLHLFNQGQGGDYPVGLLIWVPELRKPFKVRGISFEAGEHKH